MPTFEDRLLATLQQHRPDPAAAVRPPRRSGSARAAAAAVLAACALILPAALGNAGSAAYAMSTAPDGTVTFTLLELQNLDGATNALNAAGVPAVVRAATKDCTDTAMGAKAPGALLEWPVGGDSRTLRIHPTAMPAGSVLGLTALDGKAGPVVKVLLYDAPGPRCFPLGKPAQK